MDQFTSAIEWYERFLIAAAGTWVGKLIAALVICSILVEMVTRAVQLATAGIERMTGWLERRNAKG